MEQEARTKKRVPRDLLLYGFSFIILAYSIILTTDDVTEGFLILLCYIPLFLFARYLREHGGMGWQWPA